MRLLQNVQRRLTNAATREELARLSSGLHTTRIELKEASREIDRYKEDLRWTRLSQEQKVLNRQTVRDNCRYQFQRGNPFIKGAVRLMTEFCFEQGIDGPVSDDAKTQIALDEFWKEPANQEALFSTVAQHRASNQLLVDGDYFTILRTGAVEEDQRTAVRYMPATYVVDTITDPFDVARVLYYKCLVPEVEWDSGENNWKETDEKRVVFYKDIFNTVPENDPLNDTLASKVEKDAYMEHIAINAIDPASFGWPEPAVSLPWFDSHKRIAHHQEALSASTAALMTTLTVDATSSEIDTLRDEIRDRGQYDDDEANENVAGQINLLNAQADLQLSRASTQATDAETNSRMLRMAGAIGFNLPLHSLADPENANLATARSMDRPMLVHLRAYQSLWIDSYRKLIDFALAQRGIEDAQYDIPAPRIARQDISEAGKLIIDAHNSGLLTDNQAAASVLDMLGFDNVAAELAARDEEMEAEDEAEFTPLEEEELIEESSW